MAKEVMPQQIQNAVKAGFDRGKKYRAASSMFVKEFVGEYYRQSMGVTGEEPINMLFHTLKSFIPTMVMRNPVNKIITQFTDYKDYAILASKGLDLVEQQLRIKDKLRAWITSAFFGLGVIKIGVASQGKFVNFDDVKVDVGQFYIELVDLDDFVIDPICTELEKSMFYGHRISVPRQFLLDTPGYNKELVRRLPSSNSHIDNKNVKKDLTQLQTGKMAMQAIQDEVDIVEVYIPEAEAVVTIPDPRQTTFKEYIKIEDYYGPKEGPFVFLSLTPPVPGNPLPVAPISLIYDLHKMINKAFTKKMDQADEQKEIVFYTPTQTEEADLIKDSRNFAYIPSQDPSGIKQVSLGGSNQSNDIFINQLQVWFNYMAGNPDQIAGNMTPGTKGPKQTATLSSILQNNAAINIDDARDIIYDRAAEISRRLFWYMHYDPWMDIVVPIEKQNQEIQKRLTPEERRGDFIDFSFNIVARSMNPLDPVTRSELINRFCVNVLPAAVNAAMIMMQIGQPFNIATYLTHIADDWGILEWVKELFDDPEFENRLAIMMALGPKNTSDKSSVTNEGVRQNGGFPGAMNVPTGQEQFNMQAQEGANQMQSQMGEM